MAEPDQALVPTTRCMNWKCTIDDPENKGPWLAKNHKGFWVCPKCKSSYGEDPHPDLQ